MFSAADQWFFSSMRIIWHQGAWNDALNEPLHTQYITNNEHKYADGLLVKTHLGKHITCMYSKSALNHKIIA